MKNLALMEIDYWHLVHACHHSRSEAAVFAPGNFQANEFSPPLYFTPRNSENDDRKGYVR